MRLEETIQACFDKHPCSFENRGQVLIHLFCTYGNGFKWKNGELVDEYDLGEVFNGKLGEDGKARLTLSLKEVALKDLYDQGLSDSNSHITYEEFKKKFDVVLEMAGEKATKLEEYLLSESIKMIQDLREMHEKYILIRTCKEYSAIFNPPDDIQPDWKEGIEELNQYLTEKGINLKEIKKN